MLGTDIYIAYVQMWRVTSLDGNVYDEMLDMIGNQFDFN